MARASGAHTLPGSGPGCRDATRGWRCRHGRRPSVRERHGPGGGTGSGTGRGTSQRTSRPAGLAPGLSLRLRPRRTRPGCRPTWGRRVSPGSSPRSVGCSSRRRARPSPALRTTPVRSSRSAGSPSPRLGRPLRTGQTPRCARPVSGPRWWQLSSTAWTGILRPLPPGPRRQQRRRSRCTAGSGFVDHHRYTFLRRPRLDAGFPLLDRRDRRDVPSYTWHLLVVCATPCSQRSVDTRKTW